MSASAKFIRPVLMIGLAACVNTSPSVDSGDDDAVAEWTASRVVRAGSVGDSASALTDFSEIVLGPGGLVFTLHRRDRLVRVHGPNGDPRGSIGGPGEGPGEFESPRSVGLLGDTLWVTDAWDGISFFALDGEHLRDERVIMPPELGVTRVNYRLQEGAVVLDILRSGRDPSGDTIAEPLLRLRVEADRDAPSVDTIHVTRRFRPETMVVLPSTLVVPISSPWTTDPVLRYTPDGSGFCELDRYQLSASLACWDLIPSPTLRFEESIGLVGSPIASGEVEHFADSLGRRFAGVAGVSDAATSAVIKDAIPPPDLSPPAASMVIGTDARIWVGGWPGPLASEVEWVVVASDDGRLLGRVRLPAKFVGMAASGDTIWGKELDALDVSYLVAYQLSARDQ